MNQILVTEKLYLTPELRRKKKVYKFNFFLSVFLVCVLFSYYIYAEYDRTKNEEVSKEILARIDLSGEDTTTRRTSDNVLIVTLNEEESNQQEINISDLAREITQDQIQTTHVTESGQEYTTDSVLNIASLDINYPVLSETTEELLKISLTKFWGGKPNEVGNYVVSGHNYKNKKMFGRLSEIKLGDNFTLTDLTGRSLTYEVYDKYKTEPEDTSCTSQNTNGKKEVTLITCTNYGSQRLIIKAREVK